MAFVTTSVASPAPADLAAVTMTVADPSVLLHSLNAHLAVLSDSTSRDEAKLRAAQDLSEMLDVAIATTTIYPQFLDTAM
jgi:hypothetical protein